MQIGDYSIPFVVQAPSGIPGTFISMSREYSAKIDYFVKAEIQEGNKKTIGKHKTEVVFKQIIDFDRNSEIASSSVNLTCCSCFSRGQSIIRAKCNKNAYIPGEVVSL